MVFLSQQTIFSFPRPNNKFCSLVDPNKIFSSPLGHETPPPPNIKLAGTETEQLDNHISCSMTIAYFSIKIDILA